MSDGLTWLAAPEAIAFGGYSVVLARGLTEEHLVTRLAETLSGPPRTLTPLGDLTGGELLDELESRGGRFENLAFRYGRTADLSYLVMYGFWYGEFGPEPPVSRDGAHVFRVWYEEENGKPVPPYFAYQHDGRLMCTFNMHLDGSWGSGTATGDPEVAAAVQRQLDESGVDADPDDRYFTHWTCLDIVEHHFRLTLPREPVLAGRLPAVLLTT